MHIPPDDPIYSNPPIYSWRICLTSAFMTCLVGGLVLAVKSLSVFGTDLPGGSTIFPLTYGCIVVMAEVYGFKTAERQVLVGLGCLVFFACALELVVNAPKATYFIHDHEFHALFAVQTRVILIVVAAFWIGQKVALMIYRYIYGLTGGRSLYMRIFGAPCIAQIVTVVIAIPATLIGAGVTGEAIYSTVSNRVVWAIVQSALAAPVIWGVILLFRRLERDNISYTGQVTSSENTDALKGNGGGHGTAS